MMYEKGHVVVKYGGETEFIGKVVGVIDLPGKGGKRLCIRCIAPGARKQLHFYRPELVRLATYEEQNRIARMTMIWEYGSDRVYIDEFNPPEEE